MNGAAFAWPRLRLKGRLMDKKLVPSAHGPGDVEVTGNETTWRGWGRVILYRFRHKRHDGEWSGTIQRELHVVGDAANIVPYDPALDAVLLVEQIRVAGIHHGKERPWVIESIAGMVDEGEDPAATAIREAVEEGGCEIRHIAPVMSGYTSPGGWGERGFLFAGTADLSRTGGFHGLPEENEDIRAVVVPFEDALEAATDGRIEDVKTALILHWLALHRHTLGESGESRQS